MSLINDVRVKDLPLPVRQWLETMEGARLPGFYKVRAYAVSGRRSRKRTEEFERDRKRRKNRLKRIAAKMRKAGMGEKDAQVVLRGGWEE